MKAAGIYSQLTRVVENMMRGSTSIISTSSRVEFIIIQRTEYLRGYLARICQLRPVRVTEVEGDI